MGTRALLLQVPVLQQSSGEAEVHCVGLVVTVKLNLKKKKAQCKGCGVKFI